jgi:hypothetical protein
MMLTRTVVNARNQNVSQSQASSRRRVAAPDPCWLEPQRRLSEPDFVSGPVR